MKKWVLLVVLVVLCGASYAGGYMSSVGMSYTANDYYASAINHNVEAGSGISRSPLYAPQGSGDTRPDYPGEPEGANERPDHPAEPQPVGPLPYVFIALLAGGYILSKKCKRREEYMIA